MPELKPHELKVECATTGSVLVVSKTHYWKFANNYKVLEGEAGDQPEGAPKPFVYAKPPEINNKELGDSVLVKDDGEEVTPDRPPAKPPAKKVTPPKVK